MDKNTFATMADHYGHDFVHAEQVLVETQNKSHESRIQQFIKYVSPSNREFHELDHFYRPSSQSIFHLPVSTHKLSEVNLATQLPDWKQTYPWVIDRENNVNFYHHPLNDLSKLKTQEGHFLASPGSSARTMFIAPNTKKDFNQNIFLKISLERKLYGFKRTIDQNALIRAIGISQILEEKKKEISQDQEFNWVHFKETFGISLKNNNNTSFIVREMPEELLNQDFINLPLFALTSINGKETWLERLFSESGQTNKKNFLMSNIIMPMTILYSDLSLNLGLLMEFHRQNVGITWNRKLSRLECLWIRDMDGSAVDFTFRKQVLKIDNGLYDPSWNKEDLKIIYRNKEAMIAQAFYWIYMGSMSFEPMIRSFLGTKNVVPLLKITDDYFYEKTHKRLSIRPKGLSALVTTWMDFYQENDGDKVNFKQELALKFFARYRELELFLSRWV